MSPFYPFREGGMPKGDNVTFFYCFSYSEASLSLKLSGASLCQRHKACCQAPTDVWFQQLLLIPSIYHQSCHGGDILTDGDEMWRRILMTSWMLGGRKEMIE